MARGPAGGAGGQPFASSFARTKASMGGRTQPASWTAGTAGPRTGRKAQCSRSAGLTLASYCSGACAAARAGSKKAVKRDRADMGGLSHARPGLAIRQRPRLLLLLLRHDPQVQGVLVAVGPGHL